MLNEGLIVNSTSSLVKSEIVNQIRRLGPTTPDQLERSVFRALVGHSREEVDWDIPDNKAGYYTWVKTFDDLVRELVEDGYITDSDSECLAPTDAEPLSEYSHLVYPPRPTD